MVISENFKAVRIALGLTQTELGNLLEASKTMIQSYESGKAEPKRGFIEKLATLVNLPGKDLLNTNLKSSDILVDPAFIQQLRLYSKALQLQSELNLLDAKITFDVIDESTGQKIKPNRKSKDAENRQLKAEKAEKQKEFGELKGIQPDIFRTDEASGELYVVDFFEALKIFRAKNKSGINNLSVNGSSNTPSSSFPYLGTYHENLLTEFSGNTVSEFAKNNKHELANFPGLGHIDFAINVWGNSMSPEYQSGDIVLCALVQKDAEWSYVRYGETYLAICDDGPVLKKVTRAKTESELTFSSNNPDFEPYNVNKNRIEALALVKGVIKRTNL